MKNLCLLIPAVWLIISACKDSTPPDEQFMYPDSNLSFSAHIHPIFLNDCASEFGCHRTEDRAGGLDLQTSFPDFRSNHGLVVIPGRSDISILYLVLFQNYDNIPQMPLNRPRLHDEKIRAIGTWIDEGAVID